VCNICAVWNVTNVFIFQIRTSMHNYLWYKTTVQSNEILRHLISFSLVVSLFSQVCVTVTVQSGVCDSYCSVRHVWQWLFSQACVTVTVQSGVCDSDCSVRCVWQFLFSQVRVTVTVQSGVCDNDCSVRCVWQWLFSQACVTVTVLYGFLIPKLYSIHFGFSYICIWYLQLLRGSSESELRNHHLSRDPDAYFYTQQGKSSKVNTINDGSDHKSTNSAFKTLGFSASEIDSVWNIVAAILHLVSKESFQIFVKCPVCYSVSGF
jgi:hypothetical protein